MSHFGIRNPFLSNSSGSSRIFQSLIETLLEIRDNINVAPVFMKEEKLLTRQNNPLVRKWGCTANDGYNHPIFVKPS